MSGGTMMGAGGGGRALEDTGGAFFKMNGMALTRARALHLAVRPRLQVALRAIPRAPTTSRARAPIGF